MLFQDFLRTRRGNVSDSERYPKGQHAVPRETLRAEGEPFIHSATFTPVR